MGSGDLGSFGNFSCWGGIGCSPGVNTAHEACALLSVG
jgi:hypothetical protein